MRRMVRALVVGVVVVAVVRRVFARRSDGGPDADGRRGAPLRMFRDLVAHRANPLVTEYGLAGGHHSPLGLVEHVGRRSGRVYRTPVEPLRIEGGFEIPLPFGADVGWLKDVQAAGGARLQFHEVIYELDRPEVVEGGRAASLASPLRDLADRAGYRYLRVRSVCAMPGTFSHLEGRPVPATAGEPTPMAAEGPFSEFVGPLGPGTEAPVEPKMVDRAAPAG